MIAKRSVWLSGGQKCVTIARAILRNAHILILDESRSNLDPASERLVLEALERASAGRTTLTVGHGIESLLDAVRVVRLEGGGILTD